jgi:hypothetical protein
MKDAQNALLAPPPPGYVHAYNEQTCNLNGVIDDECASSVADSIQC